MKLVIIFVKNEFQNGYSQLTRQYQMAQKVVSFANQLPDGDMDEYTFVEEVYRNTLGYIYINSQKVYKVTFKIIGGDFNIDLPPIPENVKRQLTNYLTRYHGG